VDPAGQAVGPGAVVQTIVQLPLVHVEVPGQVWPQAPQLFLSVPKGSTQVPEQHAPSDPPPRLHADPGGTEAQLGAGHVKVPGVEK
jgi:hypothetical protein